MIRNKRIVTPPRPSAGVFVSPQPRCPLPAPREPYRPQGRWRLCAAILARRPHGAQAWPGGRAWPDHGAAGPITFQNSARPRACRAQICHALAS